MIHTLKSLYCQIENCAAASLPPEAVAYLLPVRFRIALFYANAGDLTKSQRYIDGVSRRRPEIAEVFERNKYMSETGASDTPLTADLTDGAVRALLNQDARRLAEGTRIFYLLGRVRVAAVFRALLLMRTAVDNIATGRDHGKRHDGLLLEIGANDFCQAITEKPAAIKAAVRERLLEQIRQTAHWDLDRRIAVFIEQKAPEQRSQQSPMRGKTVMIQGPSNRPSNLADRAADTTAVVGYYGPSSLVRPVERIDVSMYLTHKLWKMNQDDQLDIMNDVRLAVVSLREENCQALCDAVVAKYNATYSNVRTESCRSMLNGGVELFLWILGVGPSSVVITNFDMFTNPSYPSGYIANRPEERLHRDKGSWQMKKGEATLSFTLHDPSQQYAVYKCFHHHDTIKYDSVLDGVISNPFSAHIERLEALYGAFLHISDDRGST